MSDTSQLYIVAEVLQERVRQDAKHGLAPDGRPDVALGRVANVQLANEAQCKRYTDFHTTAGDVAWSDILTEEVSEAYCAKSVESLREELIQVAATAIAWVEHIDRRGK